MTPSLNISVRYAELEDRARELAATPLTDDAIADDLALLPDIDAEYRDVLELMIDRRLTRRFTHGELLDVMDSPLLTIEQKIDLFENISGYEPAEIEAVKTNLRDTRTTLLRIVASVRGDQPG